MEEPSLHGVEYNGDSGHTSRATGCIADAEDGGNADEPPLPSASSSSHLTSQSVGESRFGTIQHPSEKDAINTQDEAHMLSPKAVCLKLAVDPQHGLTNSEVSSRREIHGPNKLQTAGGVTSWQILLRQVSNSLTLVLVIAMTISYATLDFIEGGVISAVIVLNVVVGFLQDYRAEKTIQSLLAMAAPVCKVLREAGTLSTIKAEEIVPGDVVQLAVGDIVPADIRLISSINLATDEALLTGEAKAVAKNADGMLSEADAPLGDRINMTYSSTTITRGRATGVVISTGMQTEIGKIAQLLHSKADDTQKERSRLQRVWTQVLRRVKGGLGLIGTPLQVKLSGFALLLFALAILLAIIVFSVNLWELDDETLIYGICVAVAVIPESLIAVLTITISLGSKAMAKGNVIVRKMGALEAIGGVTNICSDKTGTLTQGKMSARKVFLPSGRVLHVANEGGPFDPTSGQVLIDTFTISSEDVAKDPELDYFFESISICNLASVSSVYGSTGTTGDDVRWTATGEPTEIALQVLAMRCGSGKHEIMKRNNMSLIAEHSFDSSVKRMSVVMQARDGLYCYTKGATEVILPLTNMSVTDRQKVLDKVDVMAAEGLRVLCIAYRPMSSTAVEKFQNRHDAEQDLIFAGLVGILDPPRKESAGAIKQCQAAGITVHMLTGDHLATATMVAREIGIIGPHVLGSSSESAVMTAQSFDKLSDEVLDEMDPLPYVLARCSPTTKLRMLDALHRRGRYCVMTGDGVNDSPALKGADVGVAMGINGSDVSKEAADMVLADDNFASIVSAIKEGRRLFDNIQKFLLHLLISNISQVILLLTGLAFQDRTSTSVFPLSPIEILWANLITSSFLAIGLGLEEAAADVMTRRPHSLKAGVFTRELIQDKCLYGIFMGCLCLVSYTIVVFAVGDGDLGFDCNENFNETCNLAYRARGTAYSVLTVLLSLMALEAKHLTLGLFNMDQEQPGTLSVFRTVTKNKFLFFAVLAGLVTPFPIIYIPVINQRVFRHHPLTWEWGLVLGSLVCFVALVESWKAIKRRRMATASRTYKEESEQSSIA